MDDGSEVSEYSLVELMGKCVDFEDEMTEIQAMGSNMGVQVLSTTKYHAELAGEGIEYTWGVAKSVYRKIKLIDKKGRTNFIENVEKCLSPNEHLTPANIRRFARRARCYVTYYNIEKIAQEFKTHRSALDFDSGFIHRVVHNNNYTKQ